MVIIVIAVVVVVVVVLIIDSCVVIVVVCSCHRRLRGCLLYLSVYDIGSLDVLSCLLIATRECYDSRMINRTRYALVNTTTKNKQHETKQCRDITL